MRRATAISTFTAISGALLCAALPSAGGLGPGAGAATSARRTGSGPEDPGVGMAPAERRAGARTLRMPGRVALDERRVYRLNAGMSGSMRDVAPVAPGDRVRKGELLGRFYAPEALPVLQVFLMHVLGYDPTTRGETAEGRGPGASVPEPVLTNRTSMSLYQANMRQRTSELEDMGVSASQRERVARERRLPDAIDIVAPADGVVLERNVSPGLKFDRGFELFRIADLRRVWVVADVFPQDLRHVRAGMRAEVSLPGEEPGIAATIDRILPEVDPATRTLEVRLEVENPDGALRPGMFVEVRAEVDLPPATVVPAEAVVDSGLARTVYVRSAGGALEPRRVTTGWRAGRRVAIVDGLAPGERVATPGAFVLDSETRMTSQARAAAADALEGG